MHVNENHCITIVMHTVTEEFQFLDSNSNGAISPRIRNMINTLVGYNFHAHIYKNIGTYISYGFVNLFQRAEIPKDIMEANSTLQAKKYPDVSSWPINEYEMPRHKDG